MQRFTYTSARVCLSGLLMFALYACSGEDGPPGQDGIAPDNVPPSIALLTPSAGDTLRDTLFVAASAVDNAGIERVVFYLDGSDKIDDSDTLFAEATQPPYQATFDLVALGVPNGPHAVVARAYDVERNLADTPAIIVYTERLIPPGPAVLRAWDPDSTGFFTFPTRYTDGENSFTADSLLNVRLAPERLAVIDSVRLYLTSGLVGMNYDSRLRVAIHRSDGVFPLDTLATRLLDVSVLDTVDTTAWFGVNFQNLGLPEFDRGDRFHVSVSVLQPSDTTRMSIGTSAVEKYPFPTGNRSSLWNMSGGFPRWQPMQERYPGEEFTREFMIEAWVNYVE